MMREIPPPLYTSSEMLPLIMWPIDYHLVQADCESYITLWLGQNYFLSLKLVVSDCLDLHVEESMMFVFSYLLVTEFL
jgi:hypothetical protein